MSCASLLFKVFTWKVVHEAGLCCYDPFGTSLTEDSDVTLRLLTQGSQALPESLDQIKGFFIRQPVILSQYHLEKEKVEDNVIYITLTWVYAL